MRTLAVALLALTAALPLAASKVKQKEKSFEPVPIARAADAAGQYVGIDPDFVIELNASGGGTLRNFARTATLTHVVFDGAEMTATAIYADGARAKLEATFVRRIRNGESALGLLVRNMDVRVDDSVTLQNLFCRRTSASRF